MGALGSHGGVFASSVAYNGSPYFDPLMPKTLYQLIALLVYLPGILGMRIAGWQDFSTLAIDFGIVSILAGILVAWSLVSIGVAGQWLVHRVLAVRAGGATD